MILLFLYLLSSLKYCLLSSTRRLYNFPFHWVFQIDLPIRQQSGRVLRASYGLFCLAIFASYRASMTSNAAVPHEVPVISSLGDLLLHQEYRVGISPETSALVTAMKEAPPGTVNARVWQMIIKANSSDPRALSTDRKYHIDRVMRSRYAFIGNAYNLTSSCRDIDYSDLRFSRIALENLYMTLPKNAFYKESLERVIPTTIETGLIEKLKVDWEPVDSSIKRRERQTPKSINLRRLNLLFCIICAGLGAAALSLILERLSRLLIIYCKPNLSILCKK